MAQPVIYLFDDNPAVAKAMAESLARWLNGRGQTHIALSGGSTPGLLFRLLAQEYQARIAWNKVHLYWGDERCVPPDHPESNYGTAHQLLLQHIGIPPENVHRIRGEADPEEEAERYGRELQASMPTDAEGWPVFDLILLGMGADGHTASIFPGQMELLHAPKACATARHPDSGQVRITLTGPVLNRGQHVAFLVTGSGKADRIHELLGHLQESHLYPAGYIHPAGRLSWWLDQAAAARLDKSLVSPAPPRI